MKNINEIFILILFSIIISSCSSLPKPNLNEPDSILIVPVSVINKSKFPISLQLFFTFHRADDGSKVFHTYLPKVGDSYLIFKNLKPGNYKFKRVSQSKKTKIGRNIYSNDFIMADNTITIIQDNINYTQKNKGGNWYTYNFNASLLDDGGYNKIIEKLEENENFKSWEIICKWCNNGTRNDSIKLSNNCKDIAESEGGARKISIIFHNQTNSSIEAFWVDFEGKLKSYGTINSGDTLNMSTSEKHPWVFKNVDTKKCLGTYYPQLSHDKKQLNIME